MGLWVPAKLSCGYIDAVLVNYMLLIRKCILTCISQHREKENRRPSLCTTLSRITTAALSNTMSTAAGLATTSADLTAIHTQLTEFTVSVSWVNLSIWTRRLSFLVSCLLIIYNLLNLKPDYSGGLSNVFFIYYVIVWGWKSRVLSFYVLIVKWRCPKMFKSSEWSLSKKIRW